MKRNEKMKDKRIKRLIALKNYCEDISCRKDGVECLGDCEVYILVGGFGRSSKYIQYYSDGSWWINHQLDDTEEEYNQWLVEEAEDLEEDDDW